MILETITSIIEQRKRDRIVPECALIDEVRKRCGYPENFDEVISRLENDGLIELKRTLNSKAIYLCDKT